MKGSLSASFAPREIRLPEDEVRGLAVRDRVVPDQHPPVAGVADREAPAEVRDAVGPMQRRRTRPVRAATNRALNMPYALAAAGGRLIVADSANSRLLGWGRAATGAAADRLTGQPDFAAKGDNRWGMPVRDGLSWPYGLSERDGIVAVADSGNNRVLLWELAA